MSLLLDALDVARTSPVGSSPPGLSTTGAARSRVLVIDPDLTLVTDLAQSFVQERVTGAALRGARDLASAPEGVEADVLLLALRRHNFAALTWAGQLRTLNPDAEVLFYAAHQHNPETAAARSVGVQRIVFGASGLSWVARHTAAMASVVGCRRALHEAQGALPPAPWAQIREHEERNEPFGEQGRPLPLRLAETRFRESYLQIVLGHSPDRREAARLAGVPYRTLCAMLQKLGLQPGGDDERNPG